jgi:hypothetical protein
MTAKQISAELIHHPAFSWINDVRVEIILRTKEKSTPIVHDLN